MRREQKIYRTLRRRLLARASVLAMRVALTPRGWAPGLVAVGLISGPVPATAQQIIDLATEADLTMQGTSYDRAGVSVSGAGDVNGDGIDDLIIGAYRASPNGRQYAGASYVVFGSDQGLPATIDLASDAELTIQGAAAGDQSGNSVRGAGDVNGDGIDDLIIGAHFASPNGRDGAGASYVVFGRDQGFPATIDLASDADVIIQGAAAYDFSGNSVSGAGDVNGDGIADLIIGAYRADPNGRDGAGASYVVFGRDQGFPAIIDLATDADVVIQGAETNNFSGEAVSGAGDVDGDGVDDLVIGGPAADPNGRTYAGASYVVFGNDQGLPAIIDLASDADVVIQGAAAYDFSGRAVNDAGDVNGDGIDDLIIGANDADPNGRESAGASYVIFGSDQGFPATIDLADPVNGADLIIQGAAPGDNSGTSVSGAGDVDGDGLADLIIGAIGADPNGRDRAGASYVAFGTDQGFPATIDLANDADVIIQGAAPGDNSGNSVRGAGDVNGDGIDDLIIGAFLASPNGRDLAGASYVVFGTTADPVVALEDLIADVEAASLQRGVENALTKKLELALDSLERDRINVTVFRLRAFILQVEVFRGKKVDEADADAWIADAEAIIDMLEAQRPRHQGPRAPSPMVESQE